MKKNITTVFSFTKKGMEIEILLESEIKSLIPNNSNKNVSFCTCVSMNNSTPVPAYFDKKEDIYLIRFSKKVDGFNGVSLTDELYNEIYNKLEQQKNLIIEDVKKEYEELRNAYLSGEKEFPLERILSHNWSPYAAGISPTDENYEEICEKHMIYVCKEEVAAELLIQSKLAESFCSTTGWAKLNKELEGKIDVSELKSSIHCDNTKNIFENHNVKTVATTDEQGETEIYYHTFKVDGKTYEFSESNLFDCGVSIIQIKGSDDKNAKQLQQWIKNNGCYALESIRI